MTTKTLHRLFGRIKALKNISASSSHKPGDNLSRRESMHSSKRPQKRKSEADGETTLKSPAKKRAAKVKEPYTDEGGWTIHFPNLIYMKGDVEANTKLACFDLDDTIVKIKSTANSPKNADDWKFYNKHVPAELKKFVDDGFKIVIFTNQNSIKSALEGKAAEKQKGRISNVIKEVGLPMQVFIAPAKDEMRKPGRGMWDFFLENCNGDVKPDMEASFFAGDAAGRPTDFAASDKEFAEAIGLPFKVPEDIFGEMEGKSRALPDVPSGENKNEELTRIFSGLAEDALVNGGDKGHFKAAALRKAAKALSSFPSIISEDNLRDVKKLPGVGKNSIEKIKEFLETGKIQAYEDMGKGGDTAEVEPKAAEGNAKPSDAMKFL